MRSQGDDIQIRNYMSPLTHLIFVLLPICFAQQGYAWTGELQGAINLNQEEVIVSGSGKFSEQQNLSVLGSAYLPSGRRCVVKIELI